MCCTTTIRACAQTKPETVGGRRLSHNNATYGRRTSTFPYRAQARRKRISLTEFLTLLRLFTPFNQKGIYEWE